MRISTASVIAAALSLGTPAWAQVQGTQPKTPPQAQSDESTVIRSIQVVDVKELQPEVRSKVEAVVAKASEDDLKNLRGSIDASTDAVSALKAKGMSSAQVVAVNLTNGVLTLFIKTARRNSDSTRRAAGSRPAGLDYPTAFAAARPALRPENRQPPRNVPSSER